MKKSQSSFLPPKGDDLSAFWEEAKGPLAIPMTNDYLFRALMQKNNKVLKGLICALLHLSPNEVISVEITNPIELGAAIDDKCFFLDIKVVLNSYTIINLEMQVVNEHNWPERSLSYLCRSFDNLNRGEEYQNARPVIQIGLLDFTLFPDKPEFFATYKFFNENNYSLYSDKLRLSVLDLTRIDLATEEDKQYQIDYWAALFKSVTWEEINMLAKKNEFITEASKTVYQLSQEEYIRLQCEAREDYYRRQRSVQSRMEELTSTNKTLSDMLKEKDIEIKQLNKEIATLRKQIASVNSEK